ncbi:hypothetical protein [Croceimicrobium hydrocarbonivorans]|uniref:Uncharacterized protein n=1 Tax=Croceimicrobium hydrocarbonivorans TaxID=2761580 RepID=A0A7H0VDQ6_9FLAO|nr:hypothetical protein [Croceimicrobium hydrocarbonivorans]QNR23854.1 hypothetical protein H4K34_15980 [Croceimicrobium hydrocarbonivorans]
MPRYLKLLVLFLLGSCTNQFLYLDDFKSRPSESNKSQKIHDQIRIALPESYQVYPEKFDSENIEFSLMLQAPSSLKDSLEYIQIQRIKSFNSSISLGSEYKYALRSLQSGYFPVEILESGPTDILKYEAYFIHSQVLKKGSEKSRVITFILNTENDTCFYYLSAVARENDSLEARMSALIHSLKSLEIIPLKN